MPLDLTDWATLLEVLDGIKAPFPPLAVLAQKHPKGGEGGRVIPFMLPAAAQPAADSARPRSQ